MVDRYAGAWRNRAGTKDDSAPLGAADPARHLTDTSAGRHNVDDTATTRRTVRTPYALDLPPADLVDATDSSASMTTSTAGVPVDLEPRDHANGDVEWSENNTQRDLVQPSPLHRRDRGSMWARRIRQPRLPQWDERFSTPRVPANTGTENSDNQRFLGMQFAGERDENNPAHTVQRERGDPKSVQGPPVGWHGERRIGFRIFRWDERKFPMHRVRHDSRWLPNHVAKTAQDAPAPLASNQYLSPYATLAQTRVKVAMAPMMRRAPNSWDQTAVTDGTEAPTEAFNSWGL